MRSRDPRPDVGRPSTPGTALPTLLLVEDDRALRAMLSLELADLGYAVVAAGTLGAAVAAVAEQPFGFAVLDIQLPDGRGSDLVAPLRRRNGDIAIVACSGAHGAEAEMGAELGAAPTEPRHADFAFLPKPVDLAVLQCLLQREATHRRRRHSPPGARALVQSSGSSRVPGSSRRTIGSNASNEGPKAASAADA